MQLLSLLSAFRSRNTYEYSLQVLGNKSCLVKRTGYWPHYFYSVSVHKHTTIELGQYPAILTGQAWTRTDITCFYIFGLSFVFLPVMAVRYSFFKANIAVPDVFFCRPVFHIWYRCFIDGRPIAKSDLIMVWKLHHLYSHRTLLLFVQYMNRRRQKVQCTKFLWSVGPLFLATKETKGISMLHYKIAWTFDTIYPLPLCLHFFPFFLLAERWHNKLVNLISALIKIIKQTLSC